MHFDFTRETGQLETVDREMRAVTPFSAIVNRKTVRSRRVAIVQPPGVSLLGAEKRNVWPSTQFDAALLRSAGYETVMIVTDASPVQGASVPWRELYERSERLSDAFLAGIGPQLLRTLTRRIAAARPDCILVEANDWCEGARDLCNPVFTRMLGDYLNEQGYRTVVAGPLATMHSRAFGRHYPTVILGVPGRTLPAAVAGKTGFLQGDGPEAYCCLMPCIAGTDVGIVDLDTVITAYGCLYGKCDFCPNAKAFGPGLLPRPIDRVAEDVARRPGKWISIVDPDFGARPGLARLARRLATCGKEFAVSCRLDVAERPDVRAHLAAMRVKTIKLGFETFSDTLLNRMNKGHSAEQIVNSIGVLRRDGFDVFGFLLVGSPGETRETLLETLAAVERLSDQVAWLPNIFCNDLSVEAHHYSRPQARKLGLPLDIVDRFFELAAYPRQWQIAAATNGPREYLRRAAA